MDVLHRVIFECIFAHSYPSQYSLEKHVNIHLRRREFRGLFKRAMTIGVDFSDGYALTDDRAMSFNQVKHSFLKPLHKLYMHVWNLNSALSKK